MLSVPYLNTCERPLSPGSYAIPYLNTWGTSTPPPGGRVAHLYTTLGLCRKFVERCKSSMIKSKERKTAPDDQIGDRINLN